MTVDEFTARLADPSYREYIRDGAFAGTLPEEEELLLLECALGPSAEVRLTPLERIRRQLAQLPATFCGGRFVRTTPWPKTPWPTVLLMLVRARRARPGYVRPDTATEQAAAIRDEAMDHFRKWPHMRNQLADLIQALDDAFPEAKEIKTTLKSNNEETP